MDKAPDFGSGDCRFESCHDRNILGGGQQVLYTYKYLEPVTLIWFIWTVVLTQKYVILYG